MVCYGDALLGPTVQCIHSVHQSCSHNHYCDLLYNLRSPIVAKCLLIQSLAVQTFITSLAIHNTPEEEGRQHGLNSRQEDSFLHIPEMQNHKH